MNGMVRETLMNCCEFYVSLGVVAAIVIVILAYEYFN